MAERSQHSNILLAFISLTAVIVIVSLIGFFTLGKGPEIIQGQAEADEYRVSSKVPGRILEFRVKENDNDTGWVEKIANVGSDGTDILVKAMVNIMLINVFKEKASRKFGDFKIHCMMDEIGKLHPNNVKGILDFANCRNILLVNSSPTTYNVEDYRYTYLLSKDGRSNTQVVPLLTYNKIEK